MVERERHVAGLVASRVVCVMKSGGVRSLQKLSVDYRELGETLRKLNALPVGAKAISIPKGCGEE